MKTFIIILFVLLGLVTIYSCVKDGTNQNQPSNHSDTTKNHIDTTKTTPPSPIVTITQTPLTILLPNNCQQSFTITNTGPQGSILNYTVADDGALGGFLSFTNSTGSLNPGVSTTISVSVKPAFVSSSPSLAGSSLVLNVYTPKATNYTKIAVPVNIRSMNSLTSLLIGTWNGTWTGTSYGANNPGQAQPSSPISGTWIINLQTIDTVAMTATGSLTWNGTDAYWTYTFDNNGLITSATPNPFIPNRTIKFDATNTTYNYAAPGSGCTSIHLTIAGFNNQPNPSDAFYGPWFSADFDVNSNMVSTQGNGFSTHPYAPVTFATTSSSGTVTGKKQ
jgi:hypothetical protein